MNIIEKLGISESPWGVGELTESPMINDCIAIFTKSDIPSKNADPIAITGFMDDTNEDRLKKTYSDAQLIASAPEMLDELIKEWQFIESYLGSNASRNDGFWYNEFLRRQDSIKNKILKATNKTWEEIKELIG